MVNISRLAIGDLDNYKRYDLRPRLNETKAVTKFIHILVSLKNSIGD